jgi:SNF2 family DNA or RNA helicase
MIYSPEHKAVIYSGVDVARICEVLPEARRLNGHHVVIPHDLHSMQVMRHMGYEAYSPILTGYDWPSNPHKIPKPFDHQRQMAAFMTLHPRCFNLADMGTGKTMATLWALDYLMGQGAVKKVLILSPLSTIYRVWEDEIRNHFLGRRELSVLYGDRAKRLELATKSADFYIINHDGLGVGSVKSTRGYQLGDIATFIKDNPDFNAVVVDEGSVYKDGNTNRYKVLRKVIADKPYVFWLTGTPTPVEPTNAWSQARIVRKDYTEAYLGLRERTMTRVSQFKWVPKREGPALAAQVLQPSIRFARDDCFDLPEVMIETRDVELSPLQKKAYEELKQNLRTQVGAGQINAINEATLRMKLIQIACGAVYGPDHEVHKVDCAPRLAVLEEIIEEAPAKIIIFAPLTSVINLLYHELHKRYSVAKITGAVSAKDRNEIFKGFQDGTNPRIIVADPGTMAHGLTLTAADTTIWYGPTDKPELYQQANRRMDRPGQKNAMLIVRLAATPVEREIFRRLDGREKMQGLVLDLVKEG